ncbi:hypothetical protein QTN25_008964 [Entamoeba marina]
MEGLADKNTEILNEYLKNISANDVQLLFGKSYKHLLFQVLSPYDLEDLIKYRTVQSKYKVLKQRDDYNEFWQTVVDSKVFYEKKEVHNRLPGDKFAIQTKTDKVTDHWKKRGLADSGDPTKTQYNKDSNAYIVENNLVDSIPDECSEDFDFDFARLKKTPFDQTLECETKRIKYDDIKTFNQNNDELFTMSINDIQTQLDLEHYKELSEQIVIKDFEKGGKIYESGKDNYNNLIKFYCNYARKYLDMYWNEDKQNTEQIEQIIKKLQFYYNATTKMKKNFEGYADIQSIIQQLQNCLEIVLNPRKV